MSFQLDYEKLVLYRTSPRIFSDHLEESCFLFFLQLLFFQVHLDLLHHPSMALYEIKIIIKT